MLTIPLFPPSPKMKWLPSKVHVDCSLCWDIVLVVCWGCFYDSVLFWSCASNNTNINSFSQITRQNTHNKHSLHEELWQPVICHRPQHANHVALVVYKHEFDLEIVENLQSSELFNNMRDVSIQTHINNSFVNASDIDLVSSTLIHTTHVNVLWTAPYRKE